jgi:site-specific DNA-methyltransferase (adenine-specific)
MRKEIIGNNTLYLADNLEVLAEIESKSIDLALSDPPYIVETRGSLYKTCVMSLDKYRDGRLSPMVEGFDIDTTFDLILKTTKDNRTITFCSNRQIRNYYNYFAKHDISPTICVWHKYNSVPFVNGHWRPDIEYIVVTASPKKGRLIKDKSKVFTYPQIHHKFHPTVKPLKLINKLVEVCSDVGDTVLDAFMGSGTTGVSCSLQGRNFIGIEKEANYFDISCKRIEQAVKESQEQLFKGEQFKSSR